MLFLHPIALGIIGILRPSGVFCCPRAYGPRAAENSLRAENTNDPSSKGCKNLPFLRRRSQKYAQVSQSREGPTSDLVSENYVGLINTPRMIEVREKNRAKHMLALALSRWLVSPVASWLLRALSSLEILNAANITSKMNIIKSKP